jgi:hypothetical protein
MKKLLFAICVSLLLSSCDFFSGEDNGQQQKSKKFWAQNIKEGSPYQLDAVQLAKGVQCNVWAEIGSNIDNQTAQKIADTYDNQIYQKMMNTFGFSGGVQYDNKIVAYGTMGLADWLGDGDGKLCILLLDIKDNYQKDVNESYVQGYFWAGDLYEGYGSNRCDMIYIDTNPGKPGEGESNITLAHEMQHMMSFVTGMLYREKVLDTWIDEGLSSAAEWIYSGEQSQSRISWYINNGLINGEGNKIASGLIDKGNNFYVWGNRTDENQYANLDDYATVYLFFQWLRLHGSRDIYKKIITSEYSDYNAVLDNIDYSTWASLLSEWMGANYLNKVINLGYGDDPVLSLIKAPLVPRGTQKVELASGEGVYSFSASNSTPSSNGNIRYRSLYAYGHEDRALLTYNINTVIEGDVEEGETTGIDAPAASVSVASQGRFAAAAKLGPYRIDAGDLLRRGGVERNFPYGAHAGLLKLEENAGETAFDDE